MLRVCILRRWDVTRGAVASGRQGARSLSKWRPSERMKDAREEREGNSSLAVDVGVNFQGHSRATSGIRGCRDDIAMLNMGGDTWQSLYESNGNGSNTKTGLPGLDVVTLVAFLARRSWSAARKRGGRRLLLAVGLLVL